MLTVIIIGVTVGLIYGLVAIGYSLIWQSMGLVHFAQGDLLMVGGFLAITLISMNIANMFAVLLIVFVMMALIGLIIQRSSYYFIPQSKHTTRIIATLGVGMILRNLAVTIWGTRARGLPDDFFPGSPLQLGDIAIRPVYYWTFFVGVTLVIGLVYFLYRTKFGLAMRLTAHSYTLAELMGINPGVYQTLAFMLATGLTGVAGILVSPISFVSYKMGLAFGVKGFAAAIIGGLDSLPGGLIGGIAIGLIEVFFGRFISGYVDTLIFGIMILVLILKPRGLFGKVQAEKI
jgi:branched-chain amino acid transport system permease protein